MAECHLRLSEYARASAAYQNAARYGYADSTLYLHLGQCLAAEGKYGPAVKAFEDYLQWKPKDRLAQNQLIGARMGLEKRGRRVMKSITPNSSTPVVPTTPRCTSTARSTSFISPLPTKRSTASAKARSRA